MTWYFFCVFQVLLRMIEKEVRFHLRFHKTLVSFFHGIFELTLAMYEAVQDRNYLLSIDIFINTFYINLLHI